MHQSTNSLEKAEIRQLLTKLVELENKVILLI